MIEHLANRTTSRERSSFQWAESHAVKENPVIFGSIILGERDVVDETNRALPPAGHHVPVVCYNGEEHREWFANHLLAVVALSDRGIL